LQLRSLLLNYPYQITLSSGVPSTNTVTGALVVNGGIGVSGNIYLINLVGSGNITAAGNIAAGNAAIKNSLSVGTVRSSNLYNSGYIQSTSGYIDQFGAAIVTSDQGYFTNLNVVEAVNAGTLAADSAVITDITASTASISTLNSTNVNTTGLAVNSITPYSGAQINLGAPSQLDITGGESGYALTTDGAGNLYWAPSASNLIFGDGLNNVDGTISLLETGIAAGTYTQVTVNQYGQAIDGVYVPDTLDTVAKRGATTSKAIHITNLTDSFDLNQGALVVDGGIGVGGIITASDLVIQNTVLLNALTVTSTAYLNNGLVISGPGIPLQLPSNVLSGAPTTGSVEFDGTRLYISTSSGRQQVMLRDLNQPANPAALVRAIVTADIDISNPSDVFDGVSLDPYDRIALARQSDSTQNGIYVFTSAGQALFRAADQDAVSGIYSGTVIFVNEGTKYAGSTWRIETTGPITPGSTPIVINQIASLDSVSIARLPKDSSGGLLTRTTYGSVVFRNVVTDSPFITISNASGAAGNITISSGTVPVASGGTGKNSFFGYLRGLGTTTTSANTIPIASITGVGTMATQNANAVSITGGTISTSGNVTASYLIATTGLAVSNIALSRASISTSLTVSSALDFTNGDYTTGAVRVAGGQSIAGRLQVSGAIYAAGYEVLDTNSTIDGGTY
jgi:hypothetical protein